MAKMLEYELSMKMEAEVKLKFDNYAVDMVSRAQGGGEAGGCRCSLGDGIVGGGVGGGGRVIMDIGLTPIFAWVFELPASTLAS